MSIDERANIQEQYTGKCNYCGYINDLKLPIGKHLPKGIHPQFCMKCGKPTQYKTRGKEMNV